KYGSQRTRSQINEVKHPAQLAQQRSHGCVLQQSWKRAELYFLSQFSPARMGYCWARKASIISLPSSPARSSHSAVIVSPSLARPASSSGLGGLTVIPFCSRVCMYSAASDFTFSRPFS